MYATCGILYIGTLRGEDTFGILSLRLTNSSSSHEDYHHAMFHVKHWAI